MKPVVDHVDCSGLAICLPQRNRKNCVIHKGQIQQHTNVHYRKRSVKNNFEALSEKFWLYVFHMFLMVVQGSVR